MTEKSAKTDLKYFIYKLQIAVPSLSQTEPSLKQFSYQLDIALPSIKPTESSTLPETTFYLEFFEISRNLHYFPIILL